MANFFVMGADNREYGPASVEELQKWVADGRADARTRVRREESADWLVLADVPELAVALSLTRQTPTPPLPAKPTPARTSIMAVAALVLGILGVVTCGATALLGLILGIIAMVRVNNSRGSLTGKGTALASVIVSAILLVLLPLGAALLLPALAAAQQKAQQINCMNNEKQLALAVHVYSGSHADHFPPAATWCDALHSALDSDKAFKCPVTLSTALSASRCDYAYNVKLDGLDVSKVNPLTVLLFESDAGWNANGGMELAVARHRGHTAEVAFADGHVETVAEGKLSSLRWEP